MIFQWNLSDLGRSLIALSASDPREDSSQPHGGQVISVESPLGSNIAFFFFFFLFIKRSLGLLGWVMHIQIRQIWFLICTHRQKLKQMLFNYLKWGKHFPAFLANKHRGVQQECTALFACTVCVYHAINYCYTSIFSKQSSVYHLLSKSANS